MPRPYPPSPVSPLTLTPFNIGDSENRDLAKVLGLNSLPPEVSDVVAHAIASYRTTCAISSDTTVRNTQAELAELKKKGTPYRKSVRRLADDRSGVDYTTHGILQPLAAAALGDESGAREALIQAACARSDELQKHEKIETKTETLRLLCGFLRLIFNHASAPELRQTNQESWRHCRRFAIEVFTIAGIPHDFEAHPERLTKYLGTDI
jgi:hypothetical protein